MTQRRALITGVTGQDGSYLAEFLLEKGYKVYGMVRRASSDHFERIAHLQDRIQLREGDLLTAAGGRQLATTDDLHEGLDRLEEGAELSVEVLRGSEALTVSVRFDPPAAEAGAEPA